jgi:GNAT superfamily N-acetyltransferase
MPVEVLAGLPARREVTFVHSPAFPEGAVVDLPAGRRPSGWLASAEADVDGGRVHSVAVSAPGTPLCWYVEVPEPNADPVATNLLAFSDTRFPEGAVLDAEQAQVAGVTGAHQVAALRWLPASGLVHQIYVGAAYRGRGLAVKLGLAALVLQAARGLPELHEDGRRTDLGEAWMGSLPPVLAVRVGERTEWMPPMTPAVSA